jgi:hypothetical protein
LPLGVAKFGCSTVTFTGPNSYEIMNESAHTLDAPNMEVQVVQQNPCENESNVAKLSARENKSELCDSTKCEIESIHNESERYTPHKKSELDCKMCEDVYESNPLIYTSSVLSKVCRFAKKLRKR